jgi:hypothetical protein
MVGSLELGHGCLVDEFCERTIPSRAERRREWKTRSSAA